MRAMLLILVALGLAGCALSSTPKSPDLFEAVAAPVATGILTTCADPCIIKQNMDGQQKGFEADAKAVLEGARKLVIIDGTCGSACVVFADHARPKVCITQNASFFFHVSVQAEPLWWTEPSGKTTFSQLSGVITQDQSPDIAKWVTDHGGAPRTNEADAMLVMPFSQAKQFWRVCSQEETAVARIVK